MAYILSALATGATLLLGYFLCLVCAGLYTALSGTEVGDRLVVPADEAINVRSTGLMIGYVVGVVTGLAVLAVLKFVTGV